MLETEHRHLNRSLIRQQATTITINIFIITITTNHHHHHQWFPVKVATKSKLMKKKIEACTLCTVSFHGMLKKGKWRKKNNGVILPQLSLKSASWFFFKGKLNLGFALKNVTLVLSWQMAPTGLYMLCAFYKLSKLKLEYINYFEERKEKRKKIKILNPRLILRAVN